MFLLLERERERKWGWGGGGADKRPVERHTASEEQVT